MRLGSALLFCSLSLSSIAGVVVTTRYGYKVRRDADPNSASDFFARKEHNLLAIERDGEWFRVSDGRNSGWIHQSALKKTKINRVQRLYKMNDVRKGKLHLRDNASRSIASTAPTPQIVGEERPLSQMAQEYEADGASKTTRSASVMREQLDELPLTQVIDLVGDPNF